MKTSIKRTMCVLMALVMLCCSLPLTVWAEAGGETTATTAAQATVKLDQLRVKGSNNKVYLSTPELSDGANAYSFAVPDWMETVTITFIGKEGIAATCSNNQSVIAAGTNYSVSMDLTEKKQTVTLNLKKDGITRAIDVTVNRRQIDCYIEDIMVFNGDNEITPTGSAEEGKMTFTLPSGALDGIKLRVKPRHEGSVTITNTTKKQDGDAITDNEKTQLKLNQYSTYYPTDLCDTESFDKLVEGTNRYYIEVKAGDVVRTCDVTVIVGDPNANAPTTTTTTTTTAPTAPPTQPTTATLPSVQQTIPNNQGGSSATGMLGSIPPVLWVLIGIIALVVIGSCIFMIVNMSAGSRRGGGYNNYDYDYDYGPQRPRRRRNLTEYLDDEYDDYYDDRGRGGRYDDYDDYDRAPRRGGRYDSYDGYDDYDQPPRRSSRYDDYDDYDDGYGGY